MAPEQDPGACRRARPRSTGSLEQQLIEPLLTDLGARLANGPARPLLLLNGPVGAGKSTLARLVQARAAEQGLRLAVASIDDLYLPWPERQQQLAGNPFGVGRVPPGSHDVPLLCRSLERWRRGELLRLPCFDKTLAGGEGDRSGWQEQEADALLLEGWLLGCRALGADGVTQAQPDLHELTEAERAWLPRWDQELAAWEAVHREAVGLWLLRPRSWTLPRRWRFQAEARQRRAGGGWLAPAKLEALVRATLHALPPQLYQDPLAAPVVGWERTMGGACQANRGRDPADLTPESLPLLGAVELDGRRRVCRTWRREAQASASSASSAIG